MPRPPAARASAPTRAPTRALASALALAIAFAASAAGADQAAARAPAASEDALREPSAAERALFLTAQLTNVQAPATLTYDYVAEDAGQARTDRATLALAPHAGGPCCSSHVDYLSGSRAVVLPDLDTPTGNPILLYFLEDQVRELERATHGQAAHFRRRIRMALADDATVSQTTVRWQGREVPAQEIHIAPFLLDPYRERFARESHTEYTFVLAGAVPGTVLRLTSTLPGPTPGSPPAARRTLWLADPQPAAPAGR